jgi:monolysocardiolipin acyltransferase
MSVEDALTCPSLRWRAGSSAALLFTGTLAKIFLNVGARADVHGLDKFVKLLDERSNIEGREKGLLTGEDGLDLRV